MPDQLWVNEERTRLVRLWEDGTIETAERETPDHTWGPPIRLKPEHGGGLRVLTEQQAEEVAGVLSSFIRAMAEADLTLRPAVDTSESIMWTGTDEFIRAYLNAIRILRILGKQGFAGS